MEYAEENKIIKYNKTYDNECVKDELEEIFIKMQKSIDDENFEIFTNEGETVNKNINVFGKFGDYTRVGEYAGILKLNDDMIKIEDRFDIDNDGENVLNYFFENVYKIRGRCFKEENDRLKFESLKLDTVEAKITNMNENLIASVFISILTKAFGKGTFRQYIEREYNDSRIKGRMDIDRHIIKNQLIQGKVAYTTLEYTFDNDVNKLILRTYNYLEKLDGNAIKKFMQSQYEAQKYINKLKEQYPNIDEYVAKDLINRNRHKISNPVYKSYETLRKICIEVLKNKGKYIFDTNLKKLNGILIDMDNIWKRYVTNNVIQKLRHEFKSDMAVSNANKTKTSFNYVYDEGTKCSVNISYSKIWEKSYETENIKDSEYDELDNSIKELVRANDTFNCKNIIVVFPIETSENYQEDIDNIYADDSNYFSEITYKEDYKIIRVPFIIPNSIVDYNEFKAEIRNIEKIFIEKLDELISEYSC